MERKKQMMTIVLFFVLLWGFLLSFVLLPDAPLSYSERRKLAQVPTITIEGVRSAEYMQELEEYAQDQFPLREGFRGLKARFRHQILGMQDSNGIYLAGDSAVKLETVLKEDEVRYAAEKVNEISEKYLQDKAIYVGVVPDKHYYAARPFGKPSLDYEKMLSLFRNGLENAHWIDLSGSLRLEDYYNSDAHWRQEALGEVRDTLAKAMGIMLPSMERYEAKRLYPFSGVYLGQSALPVSHDTLVYLTNETLEQAVVKSAEKLGEVFSVYAPEKLEGMDGYDVFLSGAQAILTIENPMATTQRELLLFRDSFGSSIAPLLVDAYSKITMVDLRYVSSEYIGEYVDFAAQDEVLFLYSTGIVNSGRLLR